VTRYRTIVADPPWPYDGGFWTTSHNARTGATWDAKRKQLPYTPMPLAEIATLPVADLAADDAFLFLWTTSRYLPDAFGIARDWDFTYCQVLVWSKSKDHYLPAAVAPIHAEFLLACKRGSPSRQGTFPSSVIEANRTKMHSAKPEAFLDYIEQTCPGPYLELFARRARFGWDYWGDESLGTADLARLASDDHREDRP
jgi:N6-adenosine-specific RNA methylase IME4